MRFILSRKKESFYVILYNTIFLYNMSRKDRRLIDIDNQIKVKK